MLIKFRDYTGLAALREDYALVPRFKLKKKEIFDDLPLGKPVDCSEKLLTKAIKNGCIMTFSYENPEEDHGRERVVYPMVLGRSQAGDLLLRGYHFKGWSHSANRPVEKIWRVFRMDRIKQMAFTGTFFRLPPPGYNHDDPGMEGGVIVAADFAQIRANQQALVKAMLIQGEGETALKPDGSDNVIEVEAESTGEDLLLASPWDSTKVLMEEDAATVRITFLKSQFGATRVALLGVLANQDALAPDAGEDEADKQDDRIIKLYVAGALKGAFQVVDACMADELGKPDRKTVGGADSYEVYVYKRTK
jgi:hypothetical protein